MSNNPPDIILSEFALISEKRKQTTTTKCRKLPDDNFWFRLFSVKSVNVFSHFYHDLESVLSGICHRLVTGSKGKLPSFANTTNGVPLLYGRTFGIIIDTYHAIANYVPIVVIKKDLFACLINTLLLNASIPSVTHSGISTISNSPHLKSPHQ